jgi:hypothetical protein
VQPLRVTTQNTKNNKGLNDNNNNFSNYHYSALTECGNKTPLTRPSGSVDDLYDGTSKIFRTGAAIYTALLVARSTGRW